MKKQSVIDIILLVFEILIAAILLFALVYFSYATISAKIEDMTNAGTEGYIQTYGITEVVCTLVMIPTHIAAFVLSLIGFLVAKFNHTVQFAKKHQRRYLCLMIAPLISQLLYSVVLRLILSWVF